MKTSNANFSIAGPRGSNAYRVARGFSLVELMIAMVLGLVVIAGAGSVFLASSRTYQTNQALSDVQTNSRIAFELLARDIRNAGQTPCNNNGRVANVLNDQSTDWFANWDNAVHGYDDAQTDPAVGIGTGAEERVKDTDSIQLIGASNSGLSVMKHQPDSAVIFINDKTTDLQTGNIIIVCDPDHAAITQISYNSSNVTVKHNTGAASPGNCSKGLGFPPSCGGPAIGNPYAFPPNSVVAKLVASDWYIGNNKAGGKSLYRRELSVVGGVLKTPPQEMVRNVTNMQLTYHQPGLGFVDATAVTNWKTVDAVRVHLSLESEDKRAGTDTQALTRNFYATTTVRNRVL